MEHTAERYKTTAPDTLDLAKRAELALNGLCGTVDPDDEYMFYFEVRLNTRPPYLEHSGPDTTCTPNFAEAIPQMRVMCGSDQYLDIEWAMLESLVRCISDHDGLYYAVYNPKRPWHMRTHIYAYDTKSEDCAVVGSSGMMMIVLMLRNALEKSDRLLRATLSGLNPELFERCLAPEDIVAHRRTTVGHTKT